MSEDLQAYLRSMPAKLRRQISRDLERIAEGLADDIRNAAPEGETGRLKQSVRSRRGRHDLEYYVEAGGDLTTKYYKRSAGYRREVIIDGRDNRGIARGNAGVSYDYALAAEFGTEKQPAQPFFWPTYRARRDEIRQQIEEALAKALG